MKDQAKNTVKHTSDTTIVPVQNETANETLRGELLEEISDESSEITPIVVTRGSGRKGG